jgi:16S rRNA (adenine1518-N6/adenine1519-N6)-dimethyltransferase
VANLPYSITGAVLKKFLTQEPKPKEMVLMVQKEVAERIVEKNKKRSIISLMVNFYSFPKIVCYVSKNNFWPRPKVDSALLKISKIKSIKIDPNSFFKLIKKGFSNPRKQLINNLAQLIEKEKIKKIFKNLKIDPQIRAEDLNLKDWFKIYQKFQKYL